MADRLFKIYVTLDARGFKETVLEWKILKEGAKTYTVEYIDKWGEKSVKHKKKEQIGVLSTGIFYNSITQITYGGWCFEADIDKVKKDSKEKCIHTAKAFGETLNKILAHLN